jgi:type VI protein secretion system component Hcp
VPVSDLEGIYGFLELTQDDKEIEGETLDAVFRPRKAIEITSFEIQFGENFWADEGGKPDTAKAPTSGAHTSGQTSYKQVEAPQAKKSQEGPKKMSFSVSKILDKSSPKIFELYCQSLLRPIKKGKLDSAMITLVKGGPHSTKDKVNLHYFVFTFFDLYVISYNLKANPPYPQEDVTFSYLRCQMFYTPQDWSGAGGEPPIITGWNFDTTGKDPKLPFGPWNT